MRNLARKLLGFGVFCLLAAPAAASTMSIWFKDGKKVEYDTTQINLINFYESGSSARETETPVFTDNFRRLEPAWETYGVVGGNFQAFAKVEPGRLTVRVPGGNSWGKTGLMSREPFLTIEDSPVRVQVELDERETTGVCVAFSAVRDLDIWREQNVWMTWVKGSETEGSAWFGNTQNGGEQAGEFKTGPVAPRTITVTLQPGKAELTLAGGKKVSQAISWLKTGTPVYFTVFSHPAREYAAVTTVVRSIKVFK